MQRETFEALDRIDPLAPLRDKFLLPPGVIYLDGNSLGALPRSTAARVSRVIDKEWGEDLITSWNRHDWIAMPQRVGDKIARLIGAAAGEVVVAESTSINLFKVLAAALKMRPGRRVIVSDTENFPTDLYVAEGLAKLLDQDYTLRLVAANDLKQVLGADTAALMLTQVNFRTGAIHDMAVLTAAAHAAGALAIWDLSHSAGAVPVDLNAAQADFAIGCGYKYLNGGPGAPAFVYAAARHQGQTPQPLYGWLGHAAPFEFAAHYVPAEGIRQYVVSTPSILALAALEEGIDLLLQVELAQLRAKSEALTEAFITLVEARCAGLGLSLATPRDPARRGSQVSFAHEQGYAVMQALIARGVVGDFRAPDLIRFGFSPLYIRHVDVWDAAETLRDVLVTGAWRRLEFQQRAAVT
ncbi:MAG TPA: kynureninase [Casimicrobiaceae bacterium]|nr:kynureninase [Casimicrobiaceae bacterium]